MLRVLIGLALLASPLALSAKDSLGIFESWGAFRDAKMPRCYAISQAEDESGGAYASVATWPERGISGQVYIRLSRPVRDRAPVTVRLGSQRHALIAKGRNAWARDQAMDAAIVSAMRSARTMRIYARSESGRRFSDSYTLAGVATAMDAATVACA